MLRYCKNGLFLGRINQIQIMEKNIFVCGVFASRSWYVRSTNYFIW